MAELRENPEANVLRTRSLEIFFFAVFAVSSSSGKAFNRKGRKGCAKIAKGGTQTVERSHRRAFFFTSCVDEFLRRS